MQGRHVRQHLVGAYAAPRSARLEHHADAWQQPGAIPLGVEHFGQTGTIGDLYRHFGIDAETIAARVAGLTVGRPRRAWA